MTQLETRQNPPVPDDETRKSGHGHWAMIACCIPMLVIAVVLVATGVAGPGFIFAAVMCTAMMAMMMRGMSGAGGGDHH
jgi:hypothetical protein